MRLILLICIHLFYLCNVNCFWQVSMLGGAAICGKQIECYSLLPQRRVTALVYSKLYLYKSTNECFSEPSNSTMNMGRVTPPFGTKYNHKMNFICNPIHCLLETFTGQGV